jgi:hypothetical protein
MRWLYTIVSQHVVVIGSPEAKPVQGISIGCATGCRKLIETFLLLQSAVAAHHSPNSLPWQHLLCV